MINIIPFPSSKFDVYKAILVRAECRLTGACVEPIFLLTLNISAAMNIVEHVSFLPVGASSG